MQETCPIFVQKKVIKSCSGDLHRYLDITAVLPHLYAKELLSDEEFDVLSSNYLTRQYKINALIKGLPLKGSTFLDDFLQCLHKSTDGTGHKELFNKIMYASYKASVYEKIRGYIKKVCRCFCIIILLIVLLIFTLFCALILFLNIGRLSYFGTQQEDLKMPPLSDLPKYYSTKLPKEQIYFVGRNIELKELTMHLDFNKSNTRIIGIFGGPGIGKSTLAIKAGHKVSKINVTVEYFDLSEVLYIPHLLHKILGGTTNSTQHSVMIEELKCLAAESTVPKLLIFDGCDNFFDNNQKGVIQKVFDILIKFSSQIKIIFTSKHMATFLSHFKSITLEELSVKHATELLKKLNSKLTEKDAETIADAVGNIPLALQIVGALLETNTISPEAIITGIATNPLNILSPETLPEFHQVQTSLQVSYNNLNDEYIQRCARFLANFPGSFRQDAAISVLTYMANETYFYVEVFSILEIYHNWLPSPLKCLETLVNRSLLKYHSNSNRYSFHKLVKMFLMTIQFEQKIVNQFKSGFAKYFAEYWNSFHISAHKGQYDPKIIAALDLERHNFEFMEEILPEFGSDMSYVSQYTESAELYASYSDSLMDYFNHVKKSKTANAVVKVDKKIDLLMDRRQKIAMLLDLHSKVVIADKGPQRYVELFVEMIIQVSIVEDYLGKAKEALEYLKSRKPRIKTLHKNYGTQVEKSVEKYFNQVQKFSLEVGDIDTLMEALQVKTGLSWPIEKCSEIRCGNFKKGRAYFGAQNYKKAVKHYETYINLNKNIPEHEYLYVIVMLYYCHHFNGDQQKATDIAKLLDEKATKDRLWDLIVDEKNYKKVEIIYLFYGKVRPGTPEHSLLSLKLEAHHHPVIKFTYVK
ncbi:PREDICTED: uncharacterized protein LOC109583247 [Amphimedon queenslandica]|uniref:CARD domain-containing protein n=1 Tax=Amphimedon queenslandica TaxID=400682 RepID=A0A1X7UHT7_AMPQE|nr:PREDICTED: uncharacterized protein LOC109583247 [Amphimedon queenslandica]|eukprot:XP_019854047.1 PREDICTED: uncharacterized protein LOC109583247 [Amphimedon queenslandica]